MSNLIKDYTNLFRFSGLVDSLRDSSKYLLRNSQIAQSNEKHVENFNQLRSLIKGCLDVNVSAELDFVIPELDANCTIDELFVSSNQLSKYLDLLDQTPDFMLSLEVREANSINLKNQLSQSSSSRYNENDVLHFGIGS
jgi:hypothetical protein